MRPPENDTSGNGLRRGLSDSSSSSSSREREFKAGVIRSTSGQLTPFSLALSLSLAGAFGKKGENGRKEKSRRRRENGLIGGGRF